MGVAYASVDSAPVALTGHVPRRRAPKLLALFLVLTLISFEIMNLPYVASAFPSKDLVFAPYTGMHVISVRLFVLLFFVSFTFFAKGNFTVRAWLGLRLIGGFICICASIDAIAWGLLSTTGTVWSLYTAQILSGILGFAVFGISLLGMGRMPDRVPIAMNRRHQGRALLRLLFSIAIAAALAWQVTTMNLQIIDNMRSVALLGGLGPGFFLFLPLLVLQLYGYAMWDRWQFKPTKETPAVTVIVPAHNEEYIIARTIAALDLAASGYSGHVTALILDNASTDKTRVLAEKALKRCRFLEGEVQEVQKPGKANALNAGLEGTETDFVIRVDADTVLMKDSISRAMRYFSDPSIGVIGGLPLPPGGGRFDRPRLIEVLMRHGFYSVAMGAIEGVVSVPGMFAAYRTEPLRRAGGFVGGMNGEDTEASLRIGEMGYYALIDPRIRFISEVPRSYEHLREQRMRWFRSIFHVVGRSRDVPLTGHFTMRGKVILPYMLLNTSRRAMLLPLVIFGSIDYMISFNPESLLIWQGILAVTIGAPAVMAMIAAVINGRPDAVIALPEYLVFRVIRGLLTLEAMMSIQLTRHGERIMLTSHFPSQPTGEYSDSSEISASADHFRTDDKPTETADNGSVTV